MMKFKSTITNKLLFIAIISLIISVFSVAPVYSSTDDDDYYEDAVTEIKVKKKKMSLEEIFGDSRKKINISRSGNTCTWELAVVKSEEIVIPVRNTFEKAISNGKLSIIENRACNSIIARFTNKDDYQLRQEWSDLMQSIDKPAPQVLFEILIVELIINDISQWGARFDALSEININGGGISQLVSMSPSTSSIHTDVKTSEGFKYYLTNGDNLKAMIFSGSTKNKVRVLSSPQIIASNHKVSTFKLGRTLPIISGSTISNGVTTYSYENKDIGINISLTPHMFDENEIGIEIHQEINDLISYDPDKKVADFAHKTLATSVTLGNGQTVALGGYIQSSDRVNRKGIPGLSSIPLIGRYFNRDLKT
ncbi:hypothetical protein KAJ27_13790, partial [bacterium]|nr:hypothetical protein [bacterium]